MLRKIKRQLASQRANMAEDDEDEDEDEDEQDVDVDGDSHMSASPDHNIKSEREGRDRGQQLLDSIMGEA